MSLLRTFIIFFNLALLLSAGCASSEPDFEDPRPPQQSDVDLLDAADDAPQGDARDEHDSDADSGPDANADADADTDAGDDAPGPIDLCPFGCEQNETCTDDGCVDLCQEAQYQCGDWTLRGHQINCGDCPSGACDEGQCVDICDDFSAQCDQVFWENEPLNCGECPGFERCRDNQCALPENFIDIALGHSHTCALRPNYEVRCWGNNEYGQLGNNKPPTNASKPERVTGLAGVQTLRSLSHHTCATLSASEIRCWGQNSKGALGDQSTTDRAAPVAVANLVGSADNATGSSHTCSRQESGRVRCWGDNGQGQLGKGDLGAEPVLSKNLVRLSTGDYLEEVQELTLGSAFSCALRRDNTAYCWGFNKHGQLGRGDNTTGSLWANPVDIDAPLFRIEAGFNHVCAIAVGGDVYCWGRGSKGQIGDGSAQSAFAPKRVELPGPAISISAGQEHTCAALDTGSVYCWGDNEQGQLGLGTTGGSFHSPKQVRGLVDVHIVKCGATHTCALDRHGELRCWGQNHKGQIGDGTTINRATPTAITL